jgi:transposase
MLGDEKRQGTGEMFHCFNLEELVPAGHMLRRIDAVLDLSWLRAEVADCYSDRGRPSVDPEVIVRMILLGYLYDLSEVRLCDEVRMHMGYRWFCHLQPSDRVPDRTTLVKLRNHKWSSDVWLKIMEKTVEQCIEAGLVSGKHVCIDGTKVRADAAIGSFEPIERPEPIRDHLLRRWGWEKFVPVEEATEDEEDRGGDEPRPGGSSDFRGKKLKNDEVRSTTDPDALLYRKDKGEGAAPSYIANFCADTKSRVILAAEASPGRTSGEWDAAVSMLDRVLDLVGGRLQYVTADRGYGTKAFLTEVVGRGLQPHIPVKGDATIRPIPNPQALKGCVVDFDKGRAAMHRILEELARNLTVEKMKTEGYQISRKLRLRIEHLIGEAKGCHGMDRARHRGLTKVDHQVKLTAAVMNLKRLAYRSQRSEKARSCASFRFKSALQRLLRAFQIVLTGPPGFSAPPAENRGRSRSSICWVRGWALGHPQPTSSSGFGVSSQGF